MEINKINVNFKALSMPSYNAMVKKVGKSSADKAEASRRTLENIANSLEVKVLPLENNPISDFFITVKSASRKVNCPQLGKNTTADKLLLDAQMLQRELEKYCK